MTIIEVSGRRSHENDELPAKQEWLNNQVAAFKKRGMEMVEPIDFRGGSTIYNPETDQTYQDFTITARLDRKKPRR